MLKNRSQIAFFDFCETLVNFQTADAFVNYVRERTQKPRMLGLERIRIWLVRLKLIYILETLTGWNRSINKRLILFQLKGFGKERLNALARDYYETRIKPNAITELQNLLKELNGKGWDIVLVSGGYDIYLKFFAEEMGIKDVICSRIGYKNNICTGFMQGLDCLNKNKVALLEQRYDNKKIKSISFSDSKTDIPFLSWTNEGYVISKNRHQSWVDNYNFKEIVWIEKNC